jgi:hypothetical protein
MGCGQIITETKNYIQDEKNAFFSISLSHQHSKGGKHDS